MKAPAFDYARPKDVTGALKLLAQGGKAAAGTQSLGPMLNLRLLQPPLLVDLRHIEELKAVGESNDAVTLGACVTHAEVEDGKAPDPTGGFLRAVASNIAYRAVRNRGTMGGSLVHADPAADWPSALTLLGATALIAGPGGRREVPVEKFITGLFEVDLQPDELLVAIRIPKRTSAAKYGYWKFCRKAGEFPQAIGGALRDPVRGEERSVVGANGAAPKLFPNLRPAAAEMVILGRDPFIRQLHAVALKRAVSQVT